MFIFICVYLDQKVYDSEGESYTNVKKQNAKLKKGPMHLSTVVNSGNTIQKGFKKIKKCNINVTDFDQVFYIVITCIFSYWSYYSKFIQYFSKFDFTVVSFKS
jgi:hypothetical protein